LPVAASALFFCERYPDLQITFVRNTQHPSLMLSVFIALGTLILILPASGMLWFWFVRSQD